MPWCPKCKAEYVEGIKECTTCKVELVDDLSDCIELMQKPLIYLEEEEGLRLIDFLKYSGIDSAVLKYDEELVSYAVYVLPEDEKKGATYVKIFKENEINEDAEDNPKINANVSSTYENKSDKYKEYMSSAYTLLAFGVLGIAFLAANLLGLFNLGSGVLFYIVMGALLIVFIHGGIDALKSAKKIKVQAENEEKTTASINEWFLENYTSDKVDELINDSESSEEIMFFKRIAKLKELITEEFGDLDSDYLEAMCESLINDNFN